TSEAQTAPLQCSTTGVQNIAVLVLTMPSSPPFPDGFTPSFFQQLFFGPSTGALATDSVNSAWREMSYGQTSAAGQIFGPFPLAQDYDCDHLPDLAAAAIDAADSTADFTQFTRVALMFPVQECALSGFGELGGLGSVGCQTISSPSKGSLTASIAWLPLYPYQLAPFFLGIPVHELGHNLGLNHDSSEDFGSVPLGALSDPGALAEYGSPFSAMGAAWFSNAADAPAFGQYSAEHKGNILHWLDS